MNEWRTSISHRSAYMPSMNGAVVGLMQLVDDVIEQALDRIFAALKYSSQCYSGLHGFPL